MPDLNDFLVQDNDKPNSILYWVPIDGVTPLSRKSLIEDFIDAHPARHDRDYVSVTPHRSETIGEPASVHIVRRNHDGETRTAAALHFELPNLESGRWSELVREYRDIAGAPVALEAFDTNTPEFFKHYVVPAEESLITKKEALRSFFRLHPNPTGTHIGRFSNDVITDENANDDVTSFTVKRRVRSGRVRVTINIRTTSPVEGQVEYFELAEMLEKYEDLEIINLRTANTNDITE